MNSSQDLRVNLFKYPLQFRHGALAPNGGSDDQQAVIAWIRHAPDKSVRLQSVYKTRNLALVSAHRLCQLARGDVICLGAVHHHRRFLRCQTGGRKAPVERLLQANAGSQKLRNDGLLLARSEAHTLVWSAGFLKVEAQLRGFGARCYVVRPAERREEVV